MIISLDIYGNRATRIIVPYDPHEMKANEFGSALLLTKSNQFNEISVSKGYKRIQNTTLRNIKSSNQLASHQSTATFNKNKPLYENQLLKNQAENDILRKNPMLNSKQSKVKPERFHNVNNYSNAFTNSLPPLKNM